LAVYDERLASWFCDDEPVPIEAASLAGLLDRGWDREHPGGETGSYVSLWNGVEDDVGVATFDVGCGVTASYMRNRVELRPPRPAAVPGLYRADTMVELIRTVVEAWQPQWCRVQSWSLREALGGESIDVLGSWIVYLDRGVYARGDALPEEISVDGLGEGEVFVLAPTPEELSLGTIDRARQTIVFPDEWSLLR
jgi:hypothetical protein